jgi:hypothetical protein
MHSAVIIDNIVNPQLFDQSCASVAVIYNKKVYIGLDSEAYYI